MPLDGVELFKLVGAFAAPEARKDAATALAHALGGDELIVFVPDPALGVLLPAPGLSQTLRGAAEWRAFLEQCTRKGEHVGTLPSGDGLPTPARGCAAGAGGVIVVLTGEGAPAASFGALRPQLPVLGALFKTELRLNASEVHARSADAAVGRSRVLTGALQQMRERLEAALLEAEAARISAKMRAEQAEEFADELQAQAAHLEEMAAEMEEVNAQLTETTEEAERARAAADEANRAKSEFLANMSHELRTPINAIIGYGELLEMEIAGPLNPVQRAHLERIRSSSGHLLTLISDILDLAKVEAGQMTVEHRRESITEVVRETAALVEAQYMAKSVGLDTTGIVADAEYVGDSDRARQILLNLLSNAVKFTPPGGSVSVRYGITEHPDRGARLSGTRRWTYVHVEDTGIGIEPNEMARVFQPFVQAQEGYTRTHGGTGLGLTISRQLARLMGGDLTLRSEPGKGSCFSLWLPTEAAIKGVLDEEIRVREPAG
ncbi:hypothetical protein BH23GEM5_BH23GEM5_26380 [soil metagenome]